jgi:hypothetical protein
MIFAGLRLEKDAWSGFCPTPSFRPSGRPRKPAWRLWPGRQAFGFDRRATKRSFWDDLAGNRPLVEDLDVAGRRARRIIASILLNEQALDVRRGLCPGFRAFPPRCLPLDSQFIAMPARYEFADPLTGRSGAAAVALAGALRECLILNLCFRPFAEVRLIREKSSFSVYKPRRLNHA